MTIPDSMGSLTLPRERTSDHSLIYTDSPAVPVAFDVGRSFVVGSSSLSCRWRYRRASGTRCSSATLHSTRHISGSAGTDTDPTEFLDPVYMQRYETTRYVLGLRGSGSLFGNLRVLAQYCEWQVLSDIQP